MKRSTLSRSERITGTSEFKQALKNASFYAGKYMKLGVSPNLCGFPRIGVSLRKQVFRLAVTRNKLRRRIKEIFRLNKYRIGSYDVIAIPRSGAPGLSLDELSGEFMSLAGKAGALKQL